MIIDLYITLAVLGIQFKLCFIKNTKYINRELILAQACSLTKSVSE